MSSNNGHVLQDTEVQVSAALTDYLRSSGRDDSAIVAGLVKPVTDLFTNGHANEGQLEETVQSLWSVLIDRADSISWDDVAQDRLVNLVKEIKRLPPPSHPAPQIWGSPLWSDLPTFGASMRERWNSGPVKYTSCPVKREIADSETGGSNIKWTSINAFAARLTAAKVVDLSIYAIWAMRDALETPIEKIQEEELNGTLQAASVWLQLYGRQMHDSRQIWETSRAQGNMAGGGALYAGPAGFCPERWQLWRARMDVLAREARVEGPTKQMLRDASSRIALL